MQEGDDEASTIFFVAHLQVSMCQCHGSFKFSLDPESHMLLIVVVDG